MTPTVLQQILAMLDVREQQLAGQAGELAARLREVEGEREALQITGKTLRALAAELEQPLRGTVPVATAGGCR